MATAETVRWVRVGSTNEAPRRCGGWGRRGVRHGIVSAAAWATRPRLWLCGETMQRFPKLKAAVQPHHFCTCFMFRALYVENL